MTDLARIALVTLGLAEPDGSRARWYTAYVDIPAHGGAEADLQAVIRWLAEHTDELTPPPYTPTP